VFGTCRGAFAEYVATSESSLVMKPETVTFRAGGGPCLRHSPHCRDSATRGTPARTEGSDQRRFGRRGACLAVQIARSFGAEVTGVAQHEETEMVRIHRREYGH
jgi:hypothetical protein